MRGTSVRERPVRTAFLGCCVAWAASLPAVERYYFSSEALLAGGADQEISLFADNDIDVYGYSVAFDYDQTLLTVTDVLSAGTLSADSDFFAGQVSVTRGLVGWGCVFDYFDCPPRPPGRDILPPGTNHLLARFTVDVITTEDATTTLDFSEVEIQTGRPVRNVMTNENGLSVLVQGNDTEISIETRRPAITSIEGGSGTPGTVFTVRGEFFDEAARTVMVCNTAAAHTLQPDGSLRVTAPACGVDGFAELEVCTVRGCDSEANGFDYDRAPAITSITGGQGPAGTVFTVRGANFGEPGLTVEVCGAAATHALQPDDSLRVTAPPCASEGFVEVEVCNSFGCASEPQGFFYQDEAPEKRFLRGDVNGDGGVPGTTTDMIFLANFLFLGGARPPCLAAADVNGVEGVPGTTTDLIYLANFLFLGGLPPPAPFPACGPLVEPDDIALGCETEAPECAEP
jgi:hypothetical protein